MQALMMDQPLLVSSLLTHAARHHGDVEIVSRRVEGDVHRYTYKDCERRSRKLADALTRLGLGHGARLATLAWNGYRHLELYFAVGGSGAVIHTVNPRLHLDHLAWIINHAEDQLLAFDLTCLPLVEALAPRCPTVKAFIALCARDRLPPTKAGLTLLCY
ncbi:MAG: AMP-binding protein, partial [Deltaproteobacteria bacterium]|nr:AMP-binding protein [Deltaproteobacteria bacterium]